MKKELTFEEEIAEMMASDLTTEEVLKEIDELGPLDLENDPEFVADFMKGQITEDILQAMEEEGINKNQLAERLGKTRQYVSRILNETTNFTFETVAEIAVALNRKIEARIIDKKKYCLISSDYIKQDELEEFCNKTQIKESITKRNNLKFDNYKNITFNKSIKNENIVLTA